MFGAVVLAALVIAGGYAWRLIRQADAAAATAVPAKYASLDTRAGLATGSPVRPFVLFRSTALGESYGRVALAYLDSLGWAYFRQGKRRAALFLELKGEHEC